MAINPQVTTTLTGLARRLVLEGLLSEEKARDAHEQSVKKRGSLVTYLIENKLVSSGRVAEAASREFGLPLIDLKAFDLSQVAGKGLDERLLRKHRALPLHIRGQKMFVAISDPTNQPALDEIKFTTGKATEPVLVEEDKLSAAIDEAAAASDTSMKGLEDADLDNVDLTSGEQEAPGGDVTSGDAEDAPIVRFVSKMMLDAINRGASDIHFEPYEKFYQVRFRIDGELHKVQSPPVILGSRLAARLKVLSRMDLAERRVPQDGRIKLNLSRNKAIDFRVSTCPTLFGEKICLRILDASTAQLGIDALGYEPEQKEAYLKALAMPQGMILVTGPTGSGKTVSLYTGLNILNKEDVNISTAEDPVEINLPGINQVNVNPKVGLTFASALKAFLRQDPDIIMVGEIRDLETAEIGIKAAQTGHLVLSTLHTNDAPQTVVRLMNIGVPAYNIASTLTLVIAQRLARKLCPHCKKHADIPKPELLKQGFTEADINDSAFAVFEAAGCDQCDDGYKGRTGIYQVMPFTDEMGRIIMEGGNAIQISDQAKREGVKDLRQSALKKVKDGVIDLVQANACTVGD